MSDLLDFDRPFLSEPQSYLRASLNQCRQGTLKLLAGLDEKFLYAQVHPEFSPLGWHLGHIAYIESYWLLGQRGEQDFRGVAYRKLFAADGLPKSERGNLPPLESLMDYVNEVRQAVLLNLEQVQTHETERLWRWVLQHESQHSEIMSFLLRFGSATPSPLALMPSSCPPIPASNPMATVPAGQFLQGSEDLDALDNERSPCWVDLPTYQIDRYPVTQAQFAQFIAAEGYHNPRWWSSEGWAWREAHSMVEPLYWQEGKADHPVCGVSAYEAEAYCQFVGKRLPTEAEWEKAARWHPERGRSQTYPWGDGFPSAQTCNHNHHVGDTTPVNAYPAGQSFYGCYDLLGNVWEWTATPFHPYSGFQSYPYLGYSTPYFDNQHRVLKGGSYVTRPWTLRSSFRNWYDPSVRQVLAGFRCAI